MNHAQLRADLSRDEARKRFPYTDTKGKITIAVGRNLTDRGLSEDEIDLMLHNDIIRTEILLDKYLPWWRQLSEARQLVLANMAFNMGVGPSTEDPTGKLLTFRNTLPAMQRGDTAAVVKGLESSDWAKQVGQRAVRLINMWKSED